MATVTGTLKMFDAMTGPLKQITQSMNIMISTMQQMQRETNQNINIDKSLTTARQLIASAQTDIERAINNSHNSQEKFDRSVKNTTISFGKLTGSVFALNEGLGLTQQIWYGMSSGMAYVDDLIGANARIAMVNDGLQTQAKLQEKVMSVANRTYSSYQATADLVSKLGLFTQGVFKDNQALLNFAEQFNKVLYAGGANTVSREIATLQLSQALASGRLQGDELRSIAEAAPGIMKVLADGLGVAVGALKQMGAEGQLTAGAIVKAFARQQKEIDKMFNAMPVTFGSAMVRIKNRFSEWLSTLNQANGPLSRLIERVKNLADWMGTAEGTTFFINLSRGMELLIMGLMNVMSLLGQVTNFVVQNWPLIEPIIWGIVGAMGSWFAITRLQIAAQGLLALYTTALKTALFMQTIATQGLTYAWATLNAVQKANIFLFLISLIVGLIVWIYNLWKTNDRFAAALMTAWNSILNFFDQVPIFFMKVGMGMVNAINEARIKISAIMQGLINEIISGVNQLLETLNQVAGTSFKAIAQVDLVAEEKLRATVMKKAGAQIIADLESRAQQNALRREQSVAQMLKSRAAERAAQQVTNQQMIPSQWSAAGKIASIDKVGEVGKIRDTVDISSEDLRIMRELSEMNAIQNFVSLTPTVQITGDNHFSNGYDIDTVIARINQGLEEEIASSARMVLNV